MPDKYANFEELSKHERVWMDYEIVAVERPSPVAVLAIHGGPIEPHTSEIARSLAGHTHSWYTLVGRKPERNRDLHITSTRFDEPQCLKMVEKSSLAISVHGAAGEDNFLMLGGLNTELIETVGQGLSVAGFRVVEPLSHLRGDSPQNICNRCTSGKGLQLELSMGLRKLLSNDLDAYRNFHSVLMGSLDLIPAT